mmetsp:Transcript_56986/g.135896  ORF Transcript_56986/g.135896 Transcript_56986/m.135896 type:complete len:249 (+) Transcript_56986:430-1176(+)
MHWGSPAADHHQDQRSRRPDGARRPTTAHRTGSDWSWCAMRGGRRHGGRQPRQHGHLHQLGCEQWSMRPRQPQRPNKQGYWHFQRIVHGGHWRRYRLHEPGRDVHQSHCGSLPGLPGRQCTLWSKHLGYHHGCRGHGSLWRCRARCLCRGRRPEEPQEARAHQRPIHGAHLPAPLGGSEESAGAEGCHGQSEGPAPKVGGQARLQCLGADHVFRGEPGADDPTDERWNCWRCGDVVHARVFGVHEGRV